MADNELKADLEALVEQWRKITESRPTDNYERGYHSATDARADELEEVLTEYE